MLDQRTEDAGMPGPAARAHAWAERIEAFVDTRAAAVVCFVAALAAYGLESLAWPLFHGRDDGQYLLYYLDYFHARPAFPEMMLYRTPVAPLFFGPLLRFGGATMTEIAMGVLFALSVTALAAAARTFSSWAAIATAIAFLAYPAYGALFHQVSSDPVFGALFALWLWRIAKTGRNSTTRAFAVHGVLVTALILARPAGQVFLMFALFPLIVCTRWRERLLGAGAFVGVAALLLGGWALHNHLRYGDFTISRTSGAQVPMYRVFIVDRLVGPDDGPATRELARAVQQRLLTTQPYRAYGITLQQFYSSGSSRMWEDLIGLSDRVWGWGSDYSKIRAAAIEAIRAHPGLYAHNVAQSVEYVLRAPYVEPAVERVSLPVRPRPRETILVHDRRLPKPTEGQPIPAAHLFWEDSTPDSRIWLDWSSLAHPVERYRYAADARHAARLVRDRERLLALYPSRDGSPTAARYFDAVSSHYPPMWLWLAVGCAALALRRPLRSRVMLSISLLGLALIAGTAASVPPVPQYRLPVDPAFILLGIVGLLGARRCAASQS